MLPTLAAISGMLAAAPAAAARSPVAAVEISFVTHAGEGAAGVKRVGRDGCYQTESGGSTGGAAYGHDSQAGCHRPGDVAPVFARLAAISADVLAPERETVGHGNQARGAPSRRLMPGGSETQVVLVRADGSRWVATKQATTDDILRAVDDLPSENQWYAEPPSKPVGTGAQLLVLSTAVGGEGSSWRFEGSLASDGRWWCHRSTVSPSGGEPRLPLQKASPIKNAPVRLSRTLEGTNPDTPDDGASAEQMQVKGIETSVEVVWPGQTRARLRPWRMAGTVLHRFVAETHALAPVCDVR